MNTTQYEALLKAVETGTLTQAAEELGYTQSGLTRALNSLEEEWQVHLLLRDRRGVQLTTEGQALLPYIKTVLHDQQRLSDRVSELNGLKDGLIRVGTFNSASAQWLPGIIRKFHEQYPGIHFQLVHGPDEQINSMIADGTIDLGFIAYPPLLKLDSDFLHRDMLISIFANDDPHSKLEKFPIKELPQLSYVALNENVEDEITALLHSNDLDIVPQFAERDDHAVIAMVEAGLGTSLMSVMMLQGFNRAITAVPLDPPAYRDLGIACRDKALLSAAATAFYECACDWVRNEYVPG